MTKDRLRRNLGRQHYHEKISALDAILVRTKVRPIHPMTQKFEAWVTTGVAGRLRTSAIRAAA
jgi:hypothetical protein